MTDVVQKLWGFCHTLRHDGVDYGDYIEQLTYLLFLKMADERGIDLPKIAGKTRRNTPPTAAGHLAGKSGTALTDHYARRPAHPAADSRGLLGDIFTGANTAFTNPVNLKRSSA